MRPSRPAVLASLLVLTACGAGDVAVAPGDPNTHTPDTRQQPPRDTIPLSLVGLGVTFAPHDPATGRAGDFDLRMTLRGGPLGAFGRRVTDPQGNWKSLPSYDYTLPPGTVVRAPADGVVQWVQYQADSKDYEILVRRSANATWWFDFDHLSKALVDSGATVRAGQPIGVVQTFSYNDSPRVVTYGFVELMLGNDATRLAYCPLDYAAPSVADSLRSAVRRLDADWRAVAGVGPDTTAMVAPGCLTRTEMP
jgi:hypothetical protein